MNLHVNDREINLKLSQLQGVLFVRMLNFIIVIKTKVFIHELITVIELFFFFFLYIFVWGILCLRHFGILVNFFSQWVNSGRALEELQASLFNRFRSSEGAKRSEQHIFGPIVALTFNFVVAVGIIFMNKWVCVLTFLRLTDSRCVCFW